MSYRVKISSVESGGTARHIANSIRKLSERQVEEIAKETERTMKEKIQDSIGRANSSGNLSENIYAEKVSNGWGVGNIDVLNINAPYWRHVNFGSIAIGANWQHRVPTGAFQPGNSMPIAGRNNQRWEEGTGSFSFIPGKPIAPLNYIQKTINEINRIISSVLRRSV